VTWLNIQTSHVSLAPAAKNFHQVINAHDAVVVEVG
jgi:hypothetical protein